MKKNIMYYVGGMIMGSVITRWILLKGPSKNKRKETLAAYKRRMKKKFWKK